jgi:deoxyribodipyrimidine photo-lyase
MLHPPVIHWFRRDLRLSDNTALAAAATTGAPVIPVYINSSWKKHHNWTGPNRQQFLCDCLESLHRNLESIGSRLIIRTGDAVAELEKLLTETGATTLFFNRDYDPYGRETERRLQSLCDHLGVAVHSFKDRVLHEPDEIRTGAGGDYRVFTPYSRNWLTQPKIAPQGRVTTLGPCPSPLHSDPLPTLAHWDLSASTATLPEAGEKAARERMKTFVGGDVLLSYGQKRNTPFGVTTSRLGADLRFGLISIRELYDRCQHATQGVTPIERASVETYIKELAWREFYLSLLWHHPEVFETEFNPDWREIPWPGSEEQFEAWAAGQTGFPIVDAGIRELLATGFMHNRLRMIVSMFLTKDLHCHWKLGESFFMRHLIDGENASNNGGWQWSAGTGADAAPYFRIQNPWTQTRRYDPNGDYIHQWVPELRGIAPERFFEPPSDGRPLTPDYSFPIVDHATERDRTLAFFKAHRPD